MTSRTTEGTLVSGAWLTIVGALLSGPVGVVLVAVVAPQPAWEDVQTFVANYHPVQAVPFAFGFLLLAGLALFVGAAAERMEADRGPVARAAAMFVTVGIAFASANYVAQIAYVPWVLQDDNAPLSAIVMSNPRALTWGLEMFAYGWIGVGLWMLAPAFPGSARRALIRALLVINGVASVASAGLMGFVDAWVLTPAGIGAFLLWNGLVVALMALVIADEGAR